MIQIKLASKDEIERVFELVEALLRELEDAPDEFAGLDRATTIASLKDVGGRFQAFLAKAADGACVGVATVVESWAIYAGGAYGVIDEMYVVPEFRSRGVGKLLIDAIKEYGREKGWRRIDVTAPPEEKWKRTVAFYESLGFVFTGPKMRVGIV